MALTPARLIDELAQRLPLEKLSLHSLLEEKTVPVHRMSWAYYLGGLVLFFFTVQLVTGLMLLFYYEPTVSDAHASVEYITDHVAGGALIRNLHSWSASLMIFTLALHLVTTFVMKAFVKPRELTWLTGVALLVITLTFGFTGYLLPWHQIAVNATKVGLQSIEEVGAYLPAFMADWPRNLRETIQGEAGIGQATLSRFYSLHVVVLPLLFLAVVAIHLLGVQLHGMSPGTERPSGRQEKFFPFFVLKDFTVWGLAFFAVFLLGLCLPFEAFSPYPLLHPFDPLGSTPEGIKPEWYFLFLYYPLELLPFWVVMLGGGAAFALLVFTPWIFRGASRRTLWVLGGTLSLYLLVMTVFGQQIYDLFKGGQG